MGHTMSIHSRNEQVILEFGLKKPAFRVVVNTPTSHGSIGLTTGLDPAMTLGCGGYGGNITSDNISPRHLLNIKRLAYEIAPVANRFEGEASARAVKARGTEIPARALTRRIDDFLGARGFKSSSAGKPAAEDGIPLPEPRNAVQDTGAAPSTPSLARSSLAGSPQAESAVDFVCEDDVRRAVQHGRKLLLAERAIVTPAARDLGEAHGIFRWTDRKS
jgi:acetaldehyde dehydrogenase (acetylating)